VHYPSQGPPPVTNFQRNSANTRSTNGLESVAALGEEDDDDAAVFGPRQKSGTMVHTSQT